MTAPEIALVTASFRKLAPISDQVAALFYARLFELDPSLRQMFHSDMETQGRKLMHMLGVAVESLEQFESLTPSVRQMGVRHLRYGVRESHYATVGSALLWTLQKGLGSEFTPATKAAWSATYALLANTMIAGARAPAVAA
ncbi:MAG: globin family protein [Opitutus sp.]